MAKSKEEITQEQRELFAELKKLAKRANQRIVRLERTYGKERWAVKNLRDRLDTQKLDAWTAKGRIKYNTSMTIPQLRATIKATKQFLNSATSTRTGIKEVKKKQLKAIKQSMSMQDEDFTDEDAETFYRLFEDTDFTFFVPRYFTASEFWSLIQEAKDTNATENEFVKMIELYIEIGNDLDMLARVQAIYNKYVL